MAINGYQYTDLTSEQLNRIKEIEEDINQASDEEIILLAFNH
ncbi:hypothetical protein [Halanaerobaculum tunisiense]